MTGDGNLFLIFIFIFILSLSHLISYHSRSTVDTLLRFYIPYSFLPLPFLLTPSVYLIYILLTYVQTLSRFYAPD
jgi:hypothetical protein